MPKVGRPSKYSDTLVKKICSRIANGESLRKICEDKAMPHRDTVNEWLDKKKGFSDQYARARDEQADFYAEEVIEIADTDPDPARARVRIDARKWKAGKMRPKKWGDKVVLSGDEDNPIKSEISVLMGLVDGKTATPDLDDDTEEAS